MVRYRAILPLLVHDHICAQQRLTTTADRSDILTHTSTWLKVGLYLILLYHIGSSVNIGCFILAIIQHVAGVLNEGSLPRAGRWALKRRGQRGRSRSHLYEGQIWITSDAILDFFVPHTYACMFFCIVNMHVCIHTCTWVHTHVY